MTFTCPTCSKEFDVERKEQALFRPFCSMRCKMVDLGRWLDGTYNVSEPLPDSPSPTNPAQAGTPPDLDPQELED